MSMVGYRPKMKVENMPQMATIELTDSVVDGPIEKVFKVNYTYGLDGRPVAIIVSAVRRFQCSIIMKYNNITADARSLMSLAQLEAPKGSSVTVVASGVDARQAVDELDKIFRAKSDDDLDKILTAEGIRRYKAMPSITTKPDKKEGVKVPTKETVEISQEEIDRLKREKEAHAEELYQAVQDEEERGLLCKDDIIDAYRKILSDIGNHPKTRHRLGQLYYEAGCYYSARAELEEAKRLDPSLAEDDLIRQSEAIIKELDALKPVGFVPKGIWEYGVVPEQLQDGQIIDDYNFGEYRAISLKNPEAWKHDEWKVDVDDDDDTPVEITMLYRFKTLLYRKGEQFPSMVLMLESSSFATTCICSTDLETDNRVNHGPTYKGMSYEEFKYKCIKIVWQLIK